MILIRARINAREFEKYFPWLTFRAIVCLIHALAAPCHAIATVRNLILDQCNGLVGALNHAGVLAFPEVETVGTAQAVTLVRGGTRLAAGVTSQAPVALLNRDTRRASVLAN